MGEQWSRPARFRPDELDGNSTANEQAREMATARELEWLAATDDVAPSAGFADRVMAAVAAEPRPRPVVAAVSAARRGAIFGMFAAFGDLWRVAWTGGRPMAVRAPAMALVAIVLATTLGAGALGVGALGGLFDRPDGTAPPTQLASPGPDDASPSPSPSPSPTASPSPSTSPDASESPDPSETPDVSESPDPSETTEPPPAPTTRATPTPRPTARPKPTATPRPTPTPKPPEPPESDASPSPTPRPTEH